MDRTAQFLTLYQINTRIWLRELAPLGGVGASLDDVPEDFFDSLGVLGFDGLYLLGVWQTGDAGRQLSRTNPEWVAAYQTALPDFRDEDIVGSPFAIQAYVVNRDFGGDAALARFRARLTRRGIRLILDYVPNHTAIDHPWIFEHPEYYIGGSEDDLAREPHNYKRVETKFGSRIIAHGRDPYFAGWPDTFQLNYRCWSLRQAMAAELERVAERCDGVRCDLAMLPLPDVIQRTWGDRSLPMDGTPPIDVSFWPEAVKRVQINHPAFDFMAEVYWDREHDLQLQGFDYTYDKRLYDRLHSGQAEQVRLHLRADTDFQLSSVHFLENHDEARAAAYFPPDVHRAAAVIAFLIPGLRFFHEGQFEGRKVHASLHLGRRANEPVDLELREFYRQLLGVLKSPIVRDGYWQFLNCRPAWEGNHTHNQFIVFVWTDSNGKRLLVAVNYGPIQGQCYVPLQWPEIVNRKVVLRDKTSDASYKRDGGDLQRGLYLDMPAWGHHVFEVIIE